MRTQFLCNELDQLNIPYFREPYMNIVTIDAKNINHALAERFDLVPQQHNSENKWYKIVLMDHVEVEHLTTFIAQLKATMHVEKGITA